MILTLAGLIACASGCLEFSYRQVRLGADQAEFERALPADLRRRTSVGVACLQSDWTGRAESVVLLLTDDNRVAAKMYCSASERYVGVDAQREYSLVGEVQPGLAELIAAGPLDAMRAVAADLQSYEGDKSAMEAHGWATAGIVRLLQRFPTITDTGADTARLSEFLERVPGGGEATLRMDADGVYHFAYQPAQPKWPN
jgi:hypothetical protein